MSSKPQSQSSKSKGQVSQHKLIIEYFKKNPYRDIPHPAIVNWATAEYLRKTGKVFRDPDRQIRYLHQVGLLVKVAKGVYRYDPQTAKYAIFMNFHKP